MKERNDIRICDSDPVVFKTVKSQAKKERRTIGKQAEAMLAELILLKKIKA